MTTLKGKRRRGIDVSFKYDFGEVLIKRNNTREKRIKIFAKLVRKFIRDRYDRSESNPKTSRVELSPVERLGSKSVFVFYMDVSNVENEGLNRLIAKFDSVEETTLEHTSAMRFPSIDVWKVIDDNYDVGLIVYRNVSNAKEFRQFYLDQKVSTGQCVDCIDHLYSQFVDSYIGIRGSFQTQAAPMKKDYAWYVEGKSSNPLDRIQSFNPLIDQMLIFGGINPFQYYFDCFQKSDLGNRKVLRRLVHGDLHARNIMVPVNGDTPQLIDFSWGNYGHRMKDFTLLESTIKYMLLKEYAFFTAPSRSSSTYNNYISIEDYVHFEQQLCREGLSLSEFRPSRTSKAKQSTNLPPFARRSLERAFECIKMLRSNAKKYLDFYDSAAFESGFEMEFKSEEDEYFSSLFLVSLGQIGFPTVEEIWALIGCTLLAGEIKKYHG